MSLSSTAIDLELARLVVDVYVMQMPAPRHCEGVLENKELVWRVMKMVRTMILLYQEKS
jgi:hypothetical protein